MKKFLSKLFDALCIISLFGIWPRFCVPRIVKIEKIELPIPHLAQELKGLKIVQLSDLHLKKSMRKKFLDRLVFKIESLKPDLIVLTGDFICYATLDDRQVLTHFLSRLSAPLGSFAILGNHDYAKATSVNAKGEYDIMRDDSFEIFRGLYRLFHKTTLAKRVTKDAYLTGFHEGLLRAIDEAKVQLLHNKTVQIEHRGKKFNLTGLGEYVLGKNRPDVAFKSYDPSLPGIVLAHNPDSIPSLLKHPGSVILCGHTHGYQVNIPWIRERICLLENQEFARGLHQKEGKWIYINRGVSSAFELRLRSYPEITLITLI